MRCIRASRIRAAGENFAAIHFDFVFALTLYSLRFSFGGNAPEGIPY